MLYRFYSNPMRLLLREIEEVVNTEVKRSPHDTIHRVKKLLSNKKRLITTTVVGEVGEDGILRLAVARCSKKDPFKRKRGRGIAEDRLAQGKTYKELAVTEDFDGKAFTELAKEIAEEVKYHPETVKRGAEPKINNQPGLAQELAQ